MRCTAKTHSTAVVRHVRYVHWTCSTLVGRARDQNNTNMLFFYLHQRGYVLAFVGLSVSRITQKVVKRMSTKFLQGHDVWLATNE